VRRLLVAVTLLTVVPLCARGLGQGRGQGNATPPTGRAAAPYDITGYWVALINDDWRYRMLTPPKGNVDYLPVTAEARRMAGTWDPEKDDAAGQQCKAYGAGGIMRMPARLHITWEDDNALRMDIDTGTQTRRFFFGNDQQVASSHPPAAEPTWQGYSVARWEIPGGGRGPAPAPGPGPTAARFGQLRVITTHLRPGYVRRNGVPYGANTSITEHFVRLVDTGGQEYLALTTTVDDPTYFQPAYIKTYQFKKQPDARGWNPKPCSTK
jgi:hypothetical protein